MHSLAAAGRPRMPGTGPKGLCSKLPAMRSVDFAKVNVNKVNRKRSVQGRAGLTITWLLPFPHFTDVHISCWDSGKSCIVFLWLLVIACGL